MFDNFKPIPEQRCAKPGSNLTVSIEMQPDGSLAKEASSGDPTDAAELEVMLAGGYRNRITQPVSRSFCTHPLQKPNRINRRHVTCFADMHNNDKIGICLAV